MLGFEILGAGHKMLGVCHRMLGVWQSRLSVSAILLGKSAKELTGDLYLLGFAAVVLTQAACTRQGSKSFNLRKLDQTHCEETSTYFYLNAFAILRKLIKN